MTQRAPQSAGERLRAARGAAGLSPADISARTRIAERHLHAIEEGRYADLASRTYAVGFARAYARSVGLDEQAIAAAVRAEIAATEHEPRARPVATFEPGDPARVPGRGIAWLGVLAAIGVLAAVYGLYRSFLAPGAELPDLTVPRSPGGTAIVARGPARSTAQPVAAAPAGGAVVFTAREDAIWVKFYDGAGRQLMQKQMAAGESYTVPADADRPQVWTGRPDALAITIGGRAVPPLAPRQTIVRNVPVSAAALLARPTSGLPAAAPTSVPPR